MIAKVSICIDICARYNVLINLLYHPSHQPCHEFPTLPESTSGYVRTGSEPCACGLALTTWNQILLPGFWKSWLVAGTASSRTWESKRNGSYTNCRCFLIFALRLLQLPWPQGLHPVEPWKSLKLLVQRSVEQAQVLDQFMLKAQHIIFLCSFHRFLLGSCNSGTHQAWYVQPPGRSKMGHILSCSLSHCPWIFFYFWGVLPLCHYLIIIATGTAALLWFWDADGFPNL